MKDLGGAPPERERPLAASQPSYYVGNATADQVKNSGWFLGQFVPDNLGLRHQTALELKWGVHARGERRPGGSVAYGVATTISVLLRGIVKTTIVLDGEPLVVTLQKEGDYIVFGPNLAHEWEVLEDAVVLSIRYPSIDAQPQTDKTS